MSYNQTNYNTIKEIFAQKKSKAEFDADVITTQIHAKYPEIAKIDSKLSNTGLEFFSLSLDFSGDELNTKINNLKNKNLALQEERANLLESYGLKKDIDSPKYECQICKDSGYVDGVMCNCFKKALINLTFETSGIGFLAKEQSFDTFDLKYYSFDKNVKDTMEHNLSYCRNYANSFTDETHNGLLLIGNTGLGKTHISTSIAAKVIENGFDVMYDTAQSIISEFEKKQFDRDDVVYDKTEDYLNCDLLIIDDLGTEMKNAFTISCIYNIINTRINRKKPIIISTNLSQIELRQRYEDRITSRLFGELTPILFVGKDIRALKLAD